MGHSQADKAASHERIVKMAAARFREAGVDGIGVADLMKDAGLTHGGFYRHFDSREQLVAEAVATALAEGGDRAAEAVARGQRAPLAALVDAYLSLPHRDMLASSCAVASMAADVARSSDTARAAYTAQVERYLALIGSLLSAAKGKAARRQAIWALSSLVGAISMARAVNDDALSKEILKTAGDAIKAQLGL